ncbi:hypothetical protein Tco_0603110 [Tanacetum coccineum]
MSMMGKMSFFLGLQIPQSLRGIFINQSKYALEMLKKYGLDQCDPVDILMLKRLNWMRIQTGLQLTQLDIEVENEIVELYYVKTAYRLADIFTKALARERFEFMVKRLGMRSIMPEELKLLAESDENKE